MILALVQTGNWEANYVSEGTGDGIRRQSSLRDQSHSHTSIHWYGSETESEFTAHLGPSNDDSLPQVLAHEGEGGGGVAHGVGPVQNHEGIKHQVPLLDVPGDLGPVLHRHVAGVQQRLVLVDTVDDAVAVKCQPVGVCVCVCVCVCVHKHTW